MLAGDNAMLQSESDTRQIQSPGAALEVGSLQQAGALKLAVMELEGKMDSLGKKARVVRFGYLVLYPWA